MFGLAIQSDDQDKLGKKQDCTSFANSKNMRGKNYIAYMVNLHIVMCASKPEYEKVYFIFDSFCRVWTSEESKLLKFTIETNFWDCLDGNHYKYPLLN